MLLKNYKSAMDSWTGRVDSTTDADAFRWHQQVRQLDLNREKVSCAEGLAFVLIGFCSDQGVRRNKGRPGAAEGPDAIRSQMASLPWGFTEQVCLYDAGNICCGDDITLEEGHRQLAAAVEAVLGMGLFPIVLGGGHETTFGHFEGQWAHLKKSGTPRLGILNFDAHFDNRPYDGGRSSGTMFRQIADICRQENTPYRYLPVGIQRQGNTVSLFREAQANGVEWVCADAFLQPEQVCQKVEDFLADCADGYITVCTDVFAASAAPGVSAPQAAGIFPREAIAVTRRALATGKIRGFDVCEISPALDRDNVTAKLGAALVFDLVDTLCRMRGLCRIG